ncbi:cell division protein ZapA [Methylobacterium sp. E-041]|jgi:cell division protein ZapA|uniref:cell division protein ZapA n=1 Tax=unclassified Methylobacterium TaxID=2615210 RepID=UPI001FB8F709|nr:MULTISPECIES: cell division protein ZapA [unclassified Methylobacterium]MCJ2078997.1 cell division protein ZapA [Methylobacterium sp. E-016]MCJ2109358.1 cell division protein ZapA [Methylobacterium sp. E-041]
MPQISVTIDGKSYRMACGEGEEAHLAALAADLGARVADMRKAFGEIGDMRLQVMAALTISDEVSELKRRLAVAEAEAERLRAEVAASQAVEADRSARVSDGVSRAAERIERMARTLAATAGPAGADHR